MNREQKRKIKKLSKVRKNGQSFAEAIGAKKMIEQEVRRKTHDESVTMEAQIINQRFL